MGKKKKKNKQRQEKKMETEFRKFDERKLDCRQVTPVEAMKFTTEDVKVVLPIHIYQEITTYTQLLDEEIHGLGLMKKEGANFIVTELFLLEQEVANASCEIKKVDSQGNNPMQKLMEKLINEDKNPSDIRFWWHSHNSMGVEWSGTDETTGKNYAGSEWFVSLVVNHEGKMKAKINFYKPIEFSLDCVEVVIQYPLQSIVDKCKEEIKSKVHKKTWFQASTYDHVKSDSQIVLPYGTSKVYPDELTDGEIATSEEGPFGETVTMQNERVSLRWDKWQEKYIGYDITSGERLTEKELECRLGYDYNQMADEYRLQDVNCYGGFSHAGYSY